MDLSTFAPNVEIKTPGRTKGVSDKKCSVVRKYYHILALCSRTDYFLSCSRILLFQLSLNISIYLSNFLLQEKITRFLALKKTTGRSFNAEVRNRKEYRNPDFLLHAVTYQDIDQIGSCFRKDVFDPHGYDKSDFCDELGLTTSLLYFVYIFSHG